MNVRVVRCEDDSHSQPWILSKDCTHWSMTCPRAKKAKKSGHKLKRISDAGYPVAITGVWEDRQQERDDGWPHSYDPPGYALALTRKHYDGMWVHTREDVMARSAVGSRWVPGPQGNLIECVQCGFQGAM
jgi:hypothetical protein